MCNVPLSEDLFLGFRKSLAEQSDEIFAPRMSVFEKKKWGGETMTASEDKRSDKRIACKIPIPVHISFLDSKRSIEAQLVDHCTNGVCFISDHAFFPGSPIIFKVAYSHLNGSGISDLETLPSVTLGEVRWCRQLPAESSTTFGVGVKYYPRVY